MRSAAAESFQSRFHKVLKNNRKIPNPGFPAFFGAKACPANGSFTISAKDLCQRLFAAIKRRGTRRIYCFLKA
jgi:hypothetical protein